MHDPHPAATTPFCVYTTLIGDYEELNEQPMAAGSGVPFICLTDSTSIQSNTWTMRRLDTIALPGDPVRSQRSLKIRPHEALPDFRGSLYIDNSVVLKTPPEQIFDRYPPTGPLALMPHSFRDDIVSEALEVLALGLDSADRVTEQLSHYMTSVPGLTDEKPFWTGFLIRSHVDPRARRLADEWATHVMRYSRRDQLSLNAALRATGVTPGLIHLDNRDSWCHSWPHARGRTPRPVMATRSCSQAEDALAQAGREMTQQYQDLASTQGHLQQAVSSRSWRVTGILRAIGNGTRLLAGSSGGDAAASSAEPMMIRSGHGSVIYADPGDSRAVALAEAGGSLNPPTLRMWDILLAEREWTDIIDVGTNYGEMLVNAALPPNAAITAVEPNPYIRPLLTRTLRENGITARMIDAAVTPTRGEAQLAIDREWSGTTRIASTAPPNGEAVAVEGIALEDLLPDPDHGGTSLLVKIDIEGAEVAVLRGAVDVLRRFDTIRVLTEVLHVPDDDLDWLCSEFHISAYLPSLDVLMPLDPRTGAGLRTRLSDQAVYAQDVVITPRATTGA